MAIDYQAGMAQPELTPGMKIVLEAVDPTTGDVLTDVTISDVVISGVKLASTGNELIEDVLGLPTYVPGTSVA